MIDRRVGPVPLTCARPGGRARPRLFIHRAYFAPQRPPAALLSVVVGTSGSGVLSWLHVAAFLSSVLRMLSRTECTANAMPAMVVKPAIRSPRVEPSENTQASRTAASVTKFEIASGIQSELSCGPG